MIVFRPVDVVQQVPDDPVLVDGHFVRGELGHPVVHPLLLDRGHLRRDVRLGLPAGPAGPGLDFGYERAEGQPGVAQQRKVDPDVLVDVAGIGAVVNNGLAGGNRDAVVRRGEAASDSEDHVRVGDEVYGLLRLRHGGRAESQGMVLGEDALPLHRGYHRGLKQLRQLLELVPCLRVQAALAGMYHRPLGREQRLGGRGYVRRVGRRPAGSHRLVVQLAVEFGEPDVPGYLEQHRPGLAGAELVEGTPHQLRYAGRRSHTRRPTW